MEFVDYLIKKFNISKIEDWYVINDNQIKEIISMKLIDVMFLVKKFHKDLNINKFEHNYSIGSKKSQFILKSKLTILFPNNEIIEDYRHSDLDNLELDYYIPDLKIAFEYQGEQHYRNVSIFRPTSYIQQLDVIKLQKCKENGKL